MDKEDAHDIHLSEKLIGYRRCLEIFAIVIIVILVIITTYQVFGRYVLSSTPKWSEELARILLVWLTFIGSAIAFGKGIHLKIDLLDRWLSEKINTYLNIVVDVLLVIFLFVVSLKCYQFMNQISDLQTPALGIPNYTIYLGLFIGFAASLPFVLASLIRSLKSLKGGT